MQDIHDVIVVGAGPAGSAAATILAQHGHDVLLLDRATFPREKPCGDGISSNAIQELVHIGAWEKVQAAHFHPTYQTRSVAPDGGMVEVEHPTNQHHGVVAPRASFDRLLKEHAEQYGAQFRVAQVLAPIIEHGMVRGVVARVNGEVCHLPAAVVIAADGSHSVLAAKLGCKPPPPAHRLVGVRGYVTTTQVQGHTVHLDFLPALLPGYAWMFPAGPNLVNVGVVTTARHVKHLKGSLESHLRAYLKLSRIQPLIGADPLLHSVRGWMLNTGGQSYHSRVVAGVVFAGDAGSFINPATGAGIAAALMTGRMAAQVVCNALHTRPAHREQALAEFDSYWRDTISPHLTRGYMVQQLILKHPERIALLNTLSRLVPFLGQQMSNALDRLT